MKTLRIVLSFFVLKLLAGCAGPIVPPLDLGPEWGELAVIVILLILVAFAYRPIRRCFSTRTKAPDFASAQNIARYRYARGEITEEEFQRLMKHLLEQ